MDTSDDDYISSSSSDESSDEVAKIELPVAKYKDEIIETVRNNQVVIITGKTGCGKTTQVPQYLLDAGLNNKKVIGITEPRRISTISIAKRIAKERKCTLGREVGYQIRFDTKLSSSTLIKVMTEGILLNDFRWDKMLRDYGVIIVDEVHERSINCDIVLGLLKTLVRKRRDLRIIICSASINADKYCNYFNDAKIIKIKGRLHPVKVIYLEEENKGGDIVDNIERIVKRSVEEHRGDILIFLAGVTSVIGCCNKLNDIENVIVFPLYAGLGIDVQRKALKPVKPHQTKVVISTTVAESSLTIEGIKIVIDSGYYKESDYIPRRDLRTLGDADISKAQAEQRRGRTGRTSPGICYRLYSRQEYEDFNDDFDPVILRENLADMSLSLIARDINPWSFDYLDAPKNYMLRYAEEELMDLSLIDIDKRLTLLGKEVSDLPIGARLGKVIQISIRKKSFFTTLCISAMLTEEFIFLQPWKADEEIKARKRQQKFNDRHGDNFTLLNLYKEWKVQDNPRRWCHKYFINLPIMKEVDMIVEQINLILKRKGVVSSLLFSEDKDEIKNSFLAVFYKNIAFGHSVMRRNFYGDLLEVPDNSRFKADVSQDTFLIIKSVWLLLATDYPFADLIIYIEPHILKDFFTEGRFPWFSYEDIEDYQLDYGLEYIMFEE